MALKKLNKSLTLKILSFMMLLLSISIIAFFTGFDRDESDKMSRSVVRIIETVVDRYFDIDQKDISWSDRLNTIVRKLGHFLEFTFLGISSGLFFIQVLKRKWVVIVSSFALSSIVAVLDEFRQNFVPGRGPSFTDVLIDMSGAIVGIALIFILYLAHNRIKTLENRVKELESQVNKE